AVVAGRRRADVRLGAEAARAVRRLEAGLGVTAFGARPAAAVLVRLVAVLRAVGAGRFLARGHARGRRAIGCRGAFRADAALRTGAAAAVDVRLRAIHHAVGAGVR